MTFDEYWRAFCETGNGEHPAFVHAWNAALEEAAKVAEAQITPGPTLEGFTTGYNHGCRLSADAIRKLKETP